MIVAITPRQWSGLVGALGLERGGGGAAAARAGVDFARDEGARFSFRAELFPLFEAALKTRGVGDLGPLFDGLGVCWSIYRTLSQALAEEPKLFSENPVFSGVTHAGRATYPTPGCAARLPADARAPAAAAPRIGQHTDEVLAELLNLGEGEIARLHDRGLVA